MADQRPYPHLTGTETLETGAGGAMSDRERFDAVHDAVVADPSSFHPTAGRNQVALERYLAALGVAAGQIPSPPGAIGGDVRWRLENSTVADVMTHDVVSVPEATPFQQLVDKLVQHRIGAVPVVDTKHKVLGVVSASDLLGNVVTGVDPRAGLRGRHAVRARAETARELMSAPPITTTPGTPVVEVARIAAAARVRRLPVVDPSGVLVGIVSRSDLLRVFRRDDKEIREYLVDDVLAREIELDQLAVEVEVHDGIVSLRGEVDRKSRVAALLAAVHTVAGVVGVRNQLTYRFDDTLLEVPDA